MSIIKHIFFIGILFSALYSCAFIPSEHIDTEYREEQASLSYTTLKQQGMDIYDYLPEGYDLIDNAMLASATDEADHAPIGSMIEKFQYGTWNSTDCPDNIWASLYKGIRTSNVFLRNCEDYEHKIVRDTTTVDKLKKYEENCLDIERLIAENHIMQSYLYFELIKRYGDVPIVTKIFNLDDEPTLVRSSYSDVVKHIISEIDTYSKYLIDDWNGANGIASEFGRIDMGVAATLKSRVLLYAASPLNNKENNISLWEKAALAAHEVISMNRYKLGDYGSLFTGSNTHTSKETIYSYMTGENSAPEILNYPISTPGGKTGTCPSANLVDAYENLDGTPFSWDAISSGDDPYANRDPRLQQSIVVNGSEWNGRIMQCYVDGKDGINVKLGTTTGYYLRKFLTDNLDLQMGATTIHSWILFRYAEVLLNYAEAMNEAYGPDVDHFADGMTARVALNMVRNRSGMPDVNATDQFTMRERIHHERRIELAFEGHRFWDVRRWGINNAKKALGSPIYGVNITKNGEAYIYNNFVVENRVFEDKMILYPIPQSEILNSHNNLSQNLGW
jgi:SusD family.